MQGVGKRKERGDEEATMREVSGKRLGMRACEDDGDSSSAVSPQKSGRERRKERRIEEGSRTRETSRTYTEMKMMDTKS